MDGYIGYTDATNIIVQMVEEAVAAELERCLSECNQVRDAELRHSRKANDNGRNAKALLHVERYEAAKECADAIRKPPREEE
jgi:hypothetical protein